MKNQRAPFLFLLVGVVMVGVLVLWFFSFREVVQEVEQEPRATNFPMLREQLRAPLQDLTKSFTALKDVVRQMPNAGSLPPETVANIEKKLQEENTRPLAQ